MNKDKTRPGGLSRVSNTPAVSKHPASINRFARLLEDTRTQYFAYRTYDHANKCWVIVVMFNVGVQRINVPVAYTGPTAEADCRKSLESISLKDMHAMYDKAVVKMTEDGSIHVPSAE